MNLKNPFLVCIITLLSSIMSYAQEIPIEYLSMKIEKNQKETHKIILKNEINGILVEHISLTSDIIKKEKLDSDHRFIYLFIKGNGSIIAENKTYDLVPETIFLPNSIQNIKINTVKNDTLHFLKISSKLTKQDLLDLQEFPEEHTQKVYYKKFIDTKAYTEPIKSPNTISRTILPNKYIPRIAMGTVEAIGPDKVLAHKHGMLEQLFLGLTNNKIVVYADDAKIDFPAYSVLHIPLGSSHGAEAFEGKKMYYVWMDFFRDKKGEEWLKTHNTNEDN